MIVFWHWNVFIIIYISGISWLSDVPDLSGRKVLTAKTSWELTAFGTTRKSAKESATEIILVLFIRFIKSIRFIRLLNFTNFTNFTNFMSFMKGENTKVRIYFCYLDLVQMISDQVVNPSCRNLDIFMLSELYIDYKSF